MVGCLVGEWSSSGHSPMCTDRWRGFSAADTQTTRGQSTGSTRSTRENCPANTHKAADWVAPSRRSAISSHRRLMGVDVAPRSAASRAPCLPENQALSRLFGRACQVVSVVGVTRVVGGINFEALKHLELAQGGGLLRSFAPVGQGESQRWQTALLRPRRSHIPPR